MVGISTALGDSVEQRSGTVLLAAGGVWLIDSALYVLDLFGGVSIPGAVNGTLILTAFLLTQVGVLGLYTPLADETPRLAVTGVLFVGISGLVTVVTLAWVLSAALLNQSMPPGGTLAVIVIGSLLALSLFGVASLRADVPSRACGVFLLTLAAAWSVWVITGLLIATPEWTAIAFGVAFSVVTAATGYVRHTGIPPINEKARSSAPATR